MMDSASIVRPSRQVGGAPEAVMIAADAREMPLANKCVNGTWSHDALCDRALRWLSGTMRCNPIFSSNASCEEIPDAIGWTSRYQFRGSIVIECKTSRSDFYADLKKSRYWEHPERGWTYLRKRVSRKKALEYGLIEKHMHRMGDFRFYLCQPMIVTAEMVAKHAPDHGLLWLEGRRMRVVAQAPRRANVDYVSEIRYLRFSIINQKQPYAPLAVERNSSVQMELV